MEQTTNSEVSVLVVDDNQYDLKIGMDALKREGYQLVAAESGERAWELLVENPARFSAVVLDRNLPGMSGMEVLEQIKSHEELQMLPVIMQSGLISNAEISEGLRAGVYFYLAKPFEEDLLKSTVLAAVNDFQRIQSLKSQNSQGTGAAKFIQAATFKFRGLDEAKQLAAFIAKSCPQPEKVMTGLTELLINAVEHGNLSIGYDEKTELIRQGIWLDEVTRRLDLPENREKFIVVDFSANGDAIQIGITDCGKGFDWQKYVEFEPQRLHDNHGRGIAMANKLSFDSLRFIGRGNQVEVCINL